MIDQAQHKFAMNVRNSLALIELVPGQPLLTVNLYKFDANVVAFSEIVQADLLITTNAHGFTCRFTDLSSDDQHEHSVQHDPKDSARKFAEKIHAELIKMHTQLHDAVRA